MFGLEQSYVLEGSMVDSQGEVTAGNYVWRPAGSRHEVHCPEGALVLGFFLSPNRFLETQTMSRTAPLTDPLTQPRCSSSSDPTPQGANSKS